MAYSIKLGERTVFLAGKAESPLGDYIVYEWNDGIFIPQDEDDDFLMDDCICDSCEFNDDCDGDECKNEELTAEDDDVYIEGEDDLLDEEENEIEVAVREDMEAILGAGFVPLGGLATVITPEYTTCYSQAFYRKK